MNSFLVATRAGLGDYIAWLSRVHEVIPSDGEVLTSDSVGTASGSHTIIVHRGDEVDSPVAAISLDAITSTFAHGRAQVERLLMRIDRLVRSAASPPVAIPSQWRPYHLNNFVAFFGLPRSLNVQSVRWIAEILVDHSVAFWQLTTRDEEVELRDFVPDHATLEEAREGYKSAQARKRDLLPETGSPVAARLQSLVDLAAVGAGSVTKGRTYSSWLNHLTVGQAAVLNHQGAEPLKVRGVAGSGKTLVLELKALREVYESRSRGHIPRVLYVTHSWALAHQVDEALNLLDETGEAAQMIEVLPLVAVRELIHGPLPQGVDLLGEDSLEGKKAQLELVSDSVDAIRETDLSTYRDVALSIRAGVEAQPGTAGRLRMCFDLMREFIEVMDPNQIKPGLNSLTKYLDLQRQPWMVDLPTRGSRELVFGIYREYVNRLVEEGQLTTDQALDDFRRYLESYTWNLRRDEIGYEIILVDEFHLFNDTERYILHLLTRDPDAFPRLIMAMDPRQSPFALLTGVPYDAHGMAALPGLQAPEAGAIELISTHRFTPNIHEFVCHLHKSFPNLVSLGEDWEIDVGSSLRKAESNPVVQIKLFKNPDNLIGFALEQALSMNSQGAPDDRVAVIGVGVHDLDAMTRHVRASDSRLPLTILESRDDVDLLRYSRRNVVVTTAEFAAGLQFSRVVVVSTNNSGDAGWSSSSGRVTVSQLYLAATRAQDQLLVACISGDQGVPQLLQGALESGAAVQLK